MAEDTHILAHEHSIRNRKELEASETCGCFYCCELFGPVAIQKWVKEPKDGCETALCPYCGIDSVIGSAAGYPVTVEFLKRMNHHWF